MAVPSVPPAGRDDRELPPLPPRPPAWRRALVHLRRYGTGPTLRRIRAELLLRLAESRAPRFLRAPVDRMADRILLAVDRPAPGELGVAGGIVVEGWALSTVPIVSVDLHLDGRPLVAAELGFPRTDVEGAHPRLPGAATAGFRAEVRGERILPGEHHLLVAVHDTGGGTRTVERTIELVDPAAGWHRWRARLEGPDAPPVPDEAGEAITLEILRAAAGGLATTLRSLAPADPGGRVREILLHLPPGADAAVVAQARALLAEGGGPPRRVVEAADPGALPDGGLRAWVAAGESLAPGAVPALLHAMGEGRDLVTADRDRVHATGRHADPILAPAWSPEHLLGRDLYGGVILARDGGRLRAALAAAGDPSRPAWRYALLLALADAPIETVHLSRPLLSAPAPDADAEDRWADEASAVRAALARRGRPAEVVPGPLPGTRRIVDPLPRRPTISIVVATTGRRSLVEPLLDGLERTRWPERELLLIDNGRGRDDGGIALARRRGVRVLERDEPFNWARLMNAGAAATSGELLLFLNDDIEVEDPGWVEALVRHALRPGAGIVGALLVYPDGSVQHAGITTTPESGGFGHWLVGRDPHDPAAPADLAVTREALAVTGAVLLVPRALFDALGGFDETLAVSGNDVDLCLRARAHGAEVLWTPDARLVHRESASRGRTPTPEDDRRLRSLHRDVIAAGDPFRSPSLTVHRSHTDLDWDRVRDLRDPPRGAPDAGVNLAGYLRAEMGIGEATRGMAAALRAAQIPFVLLEARVGPASRQAETSWVHAIATRPAYATTILHVNADTLPAVLSQLPAEATRGRHAIGVWAWELETIPDAWRAAFRLVDELWAPSAFVRDALAAVAPVPVHRIPHAIPVRHGPFLSRAELGLPEDRVLFLIAYDPWSVTDRKNPEGAIRAFCDAFPAGDPGVALVVKVNNPSEPDLRRLRRILPADREVIVIDRTLDRAAFDSLLHACDVFVSLHRSEGFGLVIAEAMGLGRPVISTDWSGSRDFVRPGAGIPVGYRLVPVGRREGPYDPAARWAEPDLAEASRAMRALAADPELRRRIGAAAAELVEQELSPEAVGLRIARHLRRDRNAHTS